MGFPDGVRVSAPTSAVGAVCAQYGPIDIDRVVVLRYPRRRLHPWEHNWNFRVFSFDFFDLAGRNIATYIPDTGGVVFHGPEGRLWGDYPAYLPKNEIWKLEQVREYTPGHGLCA
jgi:hypothetical protein